MPLKGDLIDKRGIERVDYVLLPDGTRIDRPEVFTMLSSPGPEMLANPDFDDGGDGWSGAETNVTKVAGGVDGGNCIEVEGTSLTGSFPALYQLIWGGFTVGKQYTASLYVKQGTLGPAGFYLLTATTNHFIHGHASAEWTKYEVKFTAEYETDGMMFYFGLGGTMLFDKASLTEDVAEPEPEPEEDMPTYTYTVTCEVTPDPAGENATAEASLKLLAEKLMTMTLQEGGTFLRSTVVETT
jgi:hypothetical protein